MNKYFLAVYTNEVKQYADEIFFKYLGNLTYPGQSLHVIDNSLETEYYDRLCRIIPEYYKKEHTVEHLDIPRDDLTTLFHRNVAKSVRKLQKDFLKSDADYFVTIESDVLVPHNLLELFEEVHDQADIIGGLYYQGFHPPEQFSPHHQQLMETHHALSGCTLYSRKIMEAIPFRWSTENMAAFPDAWICFDANQDGNSFKIANYTKIKCKHLFDQKGGRGHNRLR